VRILVADRGDGVPPEDLGHIFEPFYRVTQAQEHQTGGTGLGLSIAQRIPSSMAAPFAPAIATVVVWRWKFFFPCRTKFLRR